MQQRLLIARHIEPRRSDEGRADERHSNERQSDEPAGEHYVFQPLIPRRAAAGVVGAPPSETIAGEAARVPSAVIGSPSNLFDDKGIVNMVRVMPVAANERPAAGRRDEFAAEPERGPGENPAAFAAVGGNWASAKHPPPGSLERVGDEIQIHIGRVEVTAVPQAAPRPAAAPARKAMSLDEYLKRRDRGAR